MQLELKKGIICRNSSWHNLPKIIFSTSLPDDGIEIRRASNAGVFGRNKKKKDKK